MRRFLYIIMFLLPFAFLFGNKASVLYETNNTGFSLIVTDGLGGFYLYNEIDDEIMHFNNKLKKIDSSISLGNDYILSDLERNGTELIAGSEEISEISFYSGNLEYSGKINLLHDNHEFYSSRLMPTKSRRLFIEDKFSSRLFVYYDNNFYENYYAAESIIGNDRKRKQLVSIMNNSISFISDIGGKEKVFKVDSLPEFDSFVMDSVYLFYPQKNIIFKYNINSKSAVSDTLENEIIDFNFDLNGIYILTDYKVYYKSFNRIKQK